jgi:fibrillarin-like pre-rRNA processing protein
MKIPNFGKDYGTKSIAPGTRVYGERIVKKGKDEYRIWDPYRSKIAAALRNNMKNFEVKPDSNILYLGAGNGTTVSHLSDIVTNGLIFAVEFSPRAMIDLYAVALERKNICPILGDAHKPDEYKDRMKECDILVQDVAQRYQVDILKKNAKLLKPGSWVYLSVKARSIDVTMLPKNVFKIVRAELEKDFTIYEQINLDPYEKDHAMFVLRT